MRIGMASKSLLLGFSFLLLTLLYHHKYVWNTSNSNGSISYVMRYYGLPLHYIYQEISSPVGLSNYFKVSAVNFLIDLLFWTVIAGLIIAVVSRYLARQIPLTQQS
jgi:hypothetical protein